jgi:auxin-responsive protein IAA
VSGLDYDDTALTLALPGSSSSAADPSAAADRKRAHADHDKPPSPKYVRAPSTLLSASFNP